MKRIVKFTRAYDKRHSDPSKNYGIHGVDVYFVLKGDRGAVQFLIFTGWQLPHVQEELRGNARLDSLFPMAADLGYHSLVPRYEGHTCMGECEWLDGKPCYYDGSGLHAEPVFERLLQEGDEGVWSELEDYYREIFGGEV